MENNLYSSVYEIRPSPGSLSLSVPDIQSVNPNSFLTNSYIPLNQQEPWSESESQIPTEDQTSDTIKFTDSSMTSSSAFYDPELKIGDRIWNNKIEITKLLGQGTEAKVYQGIIVDQNLPIIAIKHYIINKDSYEKYEKILKEQQTFKSILNDNILPYYNSKIEDKGDIRNIYVAMECLETNLHNFIVDYKKSNNVNLPIKEIAYITKNILQGLSQLHEKKIIHRDIKPENILLNKNLNKIVISDFGISDFTKTFRTFSKRDYIGTPLYMPPELYLGKPCGRDCDIWSLGCVVFEMATGEKPFINLIGKQNIFNPSIYSSPLESASEEAEDVIYDKNNRVLLDFLMKCFRGNNLSRPSAPELLEHEFIKLAQKFIVK